MPVYEYRCTSCENQFELWQEVGAEAPACPECGEAVKKIFHPVRTIFKGSGFYVTDLRAEKSGASSGSSSSKSETKTESSSSSETKTETKSEPAATPAPASTGSNGTTKTETKSAT